MGIQFSLWISRDQLYQWYVVEKLRSSEIFQRTGVTSKSGLRSLLKRYEIPSRKKKDIETLFPQKKKIGPAHHCWLGGQKTWKSKRHIRPKKQKQLVAILGGKCEVCGIDQDLTLHHDPPWRICKSHDLKFLHVLCRTCHLSQPHTDR